MNIMDNEAIIDHLICEGITVSCMESCTGGMLASAITDRSGASDIFAGSFVTYSNDAKIRQGVPSDIIEKHGVYSAETAQAMAKAASDAFETRIGIGITGSLGRKDPNNPDSVNGQVYFSIFLRGGGDTREQFRTGLLLVPDMITERREMKQYVIDEVLRHLDELLTEQKPRQQAAVFSTEP